RSTTSPVDGDPLTAVLAHVDLARVLAVGHRVVHGGERHFVPTRLTPSIVTELRALTPLDPTHLPAELAMIDSMTRAAPHLPQIACFDTGFHRTLPSTARLLPIPRRYGLRRYGFHGLSFTYLMRALSDVTPPPGRRIILAHLG